MTTATATKQALKFNAEILAVALKQAKRLIPSRPTHPILGNYRLTANNGTLTIATFDLKEGMEITVDGCEAENPFDICLPPLFADIVGTLTGDVLMSWSEDTVRRITLTSLGGSFEIGYMDGAEYPVIPRNESGSRLAIPSGILLDAYQKVGFNVAKDETKQVLTGVNIKQWKDKLRIAATDGHRLSVVEVGADGDDIEVTIPGEALKNLCTIIKSQDVPEVALILDNGQLSAEVGDVLFSARTLEGVYPQYESLIPRTFEGKVTMSKTEFKQACERLNFIATLKNKIMQMKITADSLELFVESADVGAGKITVPCQGEGKSDLTLGFNIEYLLEALPTFGDELHLHYNSPTSSVTFKTLDGSHTHLLMPVQIRS